MRATTHGPRSAAGFSLIELMVSMAIGLILTLAVTGLLRASESGKRDYAALNDTSQTGTYAAYLLDRLVRSAGSGFTQRWQELAGCRLNAARAGTQLLPSTAAFTGAFAGVPQTQRLAPLIVYKGAAGASDVIAVMAGNAGAAEAPVRVQPGSALASSVRLPNTLGLRGRDLVLLTDGVGTDCLVQQVLPGFAGSADQALNFGGDWSPTSVNGVAVTQFSETNSLAASLGSIDAGSPQLQLIGVQDNGALVSLDLLRLNGGADPVPLADGVVEMRVLYGIDANGDGRIDDNGWVDPGVSPYTAAELNAGTTAARDALSNILAVRIGLILRTALSDRDRLSDFNARGVTQVDARLFSDLGSPLEQVRVFTGDARGFRYRTVETTVPLRNMLMRR